MGRARLLASVAAIALCAALLYTPALRYDLVWDDRVLVIENPELAAGNPLRLFGQSFTHSWASRGIVPHAYYRPLVVASLWLDYNLWHIKPLGYHLTNVIWNSLAVAVFVVLGLNLLGSFWPAAFAGLAFAVHPAHVESVAFVSGRTDLMMGAFLLAALLLLIRTKSITGSALLFALALLCKETAIVFPALAVPFLRRETPKRKWWFLTVLIATAAAYLAIRSLVLRGPQPAWGDVSLSQRALLVLNAVGRYATATLIPVQHRLSYPDLAAFAAPGWATGVGVAAMAVTFYAAWRERGNAVGLGCAMFILTLLPAGNIFPPGPSFMSERLLYLPSAGAVLAIAGLAARWSGRLSKVAAAASLFVCVGLALIAWQRLPVWTDELSLSQTMVRERPLDPLARGQLARALLERGQTSPAIAELRKGLELSPAMADLRYELARALRTAGDLAQARSELVQLTGQHPDYPDGQNLLGAVLLELGDAPAAADALRAALKGTPNNAMVHNNLGVALDQLGRAAEAEQEFRRAIELAPGLALALNNLGEVLLRRGNQAEAEVRFRQALAADSGYGLAYYNLGLVLELQGRREDAIAALVKAGRLMPGFPAVSQARQRIERNRP